MKLRVAALMPALMVVSVLQAQRPTRPAPAPAPNAPRSGRQLTSIQLLDSCLRAAQGLEPDERATTIASIANAFARAGDAARALALLPQIQKTGAITLHGQVLTEVARTYARAGRLDDVRSVAENYATLLAVDSTRYPFFRSVVMDGQLETLVAAAAAFPDSVRPRGWQLAVETYTRIDTATRSAFLEGRIFPSSSMAPVLRVLAQVLREAKDTLRSRNALTLASWATPRPRTPTDLRLALPNARAWVAMGDTAEAERLLGVWYRDLPMSSDPFARNEATEELAIGYVHIGRVDRALTEVASIEFQRTRALRNLAQAAAERADPVAAQRIVAAITDSCCSDYREALASLAWAQFKAGRVTDGTATASRVATTLDADDETTQRILALGWSEAGDASAAQRMLGQIKSEYARRAAAAEAAAIFVRAGRVASAFTIVDAGPPVPDASDPALRHSLLLLAAPVWRGTMSDCTRVLEGAARITDLTARAARIRLVADGCVR